MPRVKVRFFATVREAAGTPCIELDAEDISGLFRSLEDRFGPALGRLLSSARSDTERIVILVNGRNLGSKLGLRHKLDEGDEVAIFPPVSGG